MLPENWEEIRQQVLKRDSFNCVKCSSSQELHVHHIHPKYFGGSHELSNLITLCAKCHSERHIEQQARLARKSIEFVSFSLRKFIASIKNSSYPIINYYPLLRLLTNSSSFRTGQREVIEEILKGNNVIVIRPTGSGKSLIFQLPAIISNEPSIVISPLKALMKDQVENLWRRGIPVTFINSDITRQEKEERIEFFQRGAFKLLYLAPERYDLSLISNPEEIKKLTSVKIKYLIIDEAHNIEDWGHSFRLNYRRINEIKNLYDNPQIIATTATATPFARQEIINSLELDNPHVFVQGIDRPNLVLHIEYIRRSHRRAEFNTKCQKIIQLLNQIALKKKTIIYVPTIKVGNLLLNVLMEKGFSVEFFNGKLNTLDKTQIQNRFSNVAAPPLNLLIATNAFGMGIDIPDIRFVIHWVQPKSLNSYYQEIGRAGRDKKPALAILLKTDEDEGLINFMLEKSIENANLKPQEKPKRLQVEKGELQEIVRFAKFEKCLRKYIHNYFEAEFKPAKRFFLLRLMYLFFGRIGKNYKYCCTNCDKLYRSKKLFKAIQFVNRV